jgi:hypothetical protein|tara:strand:- start:520 stop:747 length:228 start_codon:yes stop_codon:yes gene_type:complete
MVFFDLERSDVSRKKVGLCPSFINIPIKIHLLFSVSAPHTTDGPGLQIGKDWLDDDLRDLRAFPLEGKSLTQKTI